MLSDLRESGSIEQDADIVMFIHRPEKYGIETDSEGNSLKGIATLIIAKHRNGSTGDIRLCFDKEFARFRDDDNQMSYSLPQMQAPYSEGESAVYASKINEQIPDTNPF